MTQINLTDVTKAFGATTAVDRVSLTIDKGELFFLLGPSGCGKSTLLRMIAGLIDPTGGTIRFGDRDVTHLPTGKRNAAMVFQGYALWPHMTVRQNVEFGLNVRKTPKEDSRRRVADALRTVRMEELADRRPGQLSGGQQQRVALARALVVQPDVLLLDEPLSNLDAKLRIEMRSEIRRICNETRVTTVYVTHDQEEALSMADRIAVMRDGRLCQVGPPTELYSRPGSRFVAGFLGHTNLLTANADGGGAGAGQVFASRVGPVRSAAAPTGLGRGQEVYLSVRPEAFRLTGHSADEVNQFSGRVVDSVYLGHVAQHIVELADGLRVTVDELRPRGRLSTSQSINLAVDPHDVVVLTE
jgi:iron(III) transport system ATP-binding protein